MLTTALAVAGPEDPKTRREANATQVASAWFTAVCKGETAVATALSDVPFDADGKEQIKTVADLQQLYDRIVQQKGKREPKVDRVVINASNEDEVRVRLETDGEAVVVTVQTREAFRVVGFRD